MKNYEKTIREYAHVLEQHPELAKALNQEREELKKRREQMIRLGEITAHGTKNLLGKLSGSISLLKMRHLTEKDLTEEQITRLYEIMGTSVGQLINLNTLLELQGMSKKDLREESSIINFEDISRGHIRGHDQDMEKAGVGINFKYDRINGKPIEAYAHLGIMEAIIETLFGDAVKHALPGFAINCGLRIHQENLESMIENATNGKPVRPGPGFGRGVGFPFVKEIIEEKYGGKLIRYHTPQMARDYHHFERYGCPNGKSALPETEIFGVKITIPMSELTPPRGYTPNPDKDAA